MRSLLIVAMLIVVGAIASGCSEEDCVDCVDVKTPRDAEVVEIRLTGIRLDPGTFHETSEFGLGIVALDADGRSILSDQVGFKVAIDNVDVKASPTRKEILPSSDNPLAAAILVDDSGSMRTNDPGYNRADAAELFWNVVLGNDENAVTGMFDFGGCGTFRTLQDFTNDATLLSAAKTSLSAYGETPLYSASVKAIEKLDDTYAYDAFDRVLLVLTDGQPNCGEGLTYQNHVVDESISRGVPIYTVGLGPASDLSPSANIGAVQVAQNLAQKTGGVYAAATDAVALQSVFENIGVGISLGQIVAYFEMLDPIPAAGTLVSGVVTVTSGGVSQSTQFGFEVPYVAVPPPAFAAEQ